MHLKSVYSDQGHSPQVRNLISLSQASSQPNLFFQPFQPARQNLQARSIQGNQSFHNNSPLNSESHRFFKAGQSPSRMSQTSLLSLQTQRQAISHNIRVPEDQQRTKTSEFNDYGCHEIQNEEELKEFVWKSDEKQSSIPNDDQQNFIKDQIDNKQNVTFEQLKEYDKLVIQLIKEQINQENRQRLAFYQQMQKQQPQQQQRSDYDSVQKQQQLQQKRNPFQAKIPKIFSKPRFPVTKSFSGKNKSQTQNFNQFRKEQQPQQEQNRQQQNNFNSGKNCNKMNCQKPYVFDGQQRQRTQNNQPQPSKQFQRQQVEIKADLEEEEMIEEIIEIEESEENLSKEKKSIQQNYDDYEADLQPEEQHSGTYGTNIAGGGRGSLGSMIDSNYYGIEQLMYFNQNFMDEESKSQQHDYRQNEYHGCSQNLIKVSNYIGDAQLMGDDSLKLLNMQNQFSEAVSQFEVLNEQTQLRAGSEQFILHGEAGSCGIENGEYQHEVRDLDIIFGHHQIENLTENEENDALFYVPRCLVSNEKQQKQNNIAQKADSSHNQSLVAMFNSSLIFEDDGKNQSLDGLRSQDLDRESPIQNQAIVVRQEIEEEKKEAPFEYDDDIVNQNSSLEFSHRSNQSFANNLHQSSIRSRCLKCQCNQKKRGIRSSKVIQESHQNDSNLVTQIIQKGKSQDKKSNEKNGPDRFTYFSAASLSDDRWVCPICLDIFVDAVETPCCNNLFCERCIIQTQNCPLCSKRIIDALKPNIPIRRLVLELSITCINELCNQVIKRCEIEKHNQVCQFLPIECPNNSFCGNIIRKDLTHHCEQICSYRMVQCLLNCGHRMPLNLMDDHIRDECINTELQCRNKCNEIVLRGKMEHHLNIECTLQLVACPNKGESLFEEGCSAVLKRKDLEQHKANCIFRRVVCQNLRCSSILIFKDICTHDERCLFKIVECENKCGQRTLRQHIQQHKEVCEFQLVKCPYYDLGCKIEVLRKDSNQHLMEEGFNHSVIFIEGQKRKNKEIDEIKAEMRSLRQDYNSEVQWMYNEVNQLKIQMRQLLRGSQADTSQTFDIYANRSLPQSVQLRLHPHNQESNQSTSILQQKQQATHVFSVQAEQIQNHNHIGGSRYLPGSERMSVASVSHTNQLVDHSQNCSLPQNQNPVSGGSLLDRPVTRRGRQSNTRLVDFSQHQNIEEPQLDVVRVFNNQLPRNFDSVLDGHSLDNIVINDNNQLNQDRPKVTYNNFFQRTFEHKNHRHQPRLEESPIVSINEQEPLFGMRMQNSGSFSQELHHENVWGQGQKDTCLRGISQINPLTAISNPNFSRKNRLSENLQRSNDDVDGLNFGSLNQRPARNTSLRSLESEVNLHNISSEQNELKLDAIQPNHELRQRQSEEMKYQLDIFAPKTRNKNQIVIQNQNNILAYQKFENHPEQDCNKANFGKFLQTQRESQSKTRENTSPHKFEGKPPMSGQLINSIPKTRLSTLARLSITQGTGDQQRLSPIEPSIKSQALNRVIQPYNSRQVNKIKQDIMLNKNDHDSSNVLYDEDFEANDENIFN